MKKIIIICCLAAFAATTQAQTWTPNKSFISAKRDSAKAENKNKYQCWGTCKTGKRCNRKVATDHSFCYQHLNQTK